MTCTEQSVGNGVVAAEAGAAKPMVAAAKAVAADRAKVNFFISTPSVTYRTKPRSTMLSCREDPIRNLNPLPYRQISSVRYSQGFRSWNCRDSCDLWDACGVCQQCCAPLSPRTPMSARLPF